MCARGGGVSAAAVVIVRCCGQDYPRTGNYSRVLTRSNARKDDGIGMRAGAGEGVLGCWTPLGLRALVRKTARGPGARECTLFSRRSKQMDDRHRRM